MPSPQMMYLQVADSLRQIKAMKRSTKTGRFVSRYPLLAERDIVVLWGMYRGWSDRSIADAIRTSDRTVRNIRNRYYSNPRMIFHHPVLHQIVRYRAPLWICLFCGAQLTTAEKDAREHVAMHVMSPHVFKLLGVMPRDHY